MWASAGRLGNHMENQQICMRILEDRIRLRADIGISFTAEFPLRAY